MCRSAATSASAASSHARVLRMQCKAQGGASPHFRERGHFLGGNVLVKKGRRPFSSANTLPSFERRPSSKPVARSPKREQAPAPVFTAEQSISLALPFFLRSLLSLIKATKAPSFGPSFLNRAVTGMHSVNPLIAAAVALEGPEERGRRRVDGLGAPSFFLAPVSLFLTLPSFLTSCLTRKPTARPPTAITAFAHCLVRPFGRRLPAFFAFYPPRPDTVCVSEWGMDWKRIRHCVQSALFLSCMSPW